MNVFCPHLTAFSGGANLAGIQPKKGHMVKRSLMLPGNYL
jgi:hypothetical protein